jgi:hypothetical protein
MRKKAGRCIGVSDMDVLIRLIKDVLKILQNISEEDYGILESVDFSELKQELGAWFIADYPLYQGS